MKKYLILPFLMMANQAYAEVDFVPLKMELGYWEISSSVNIDDMLAQVPEEQRAMMRNMLTNQVEKTVVKQCITAESQKNMQIKMMDAFSKNNGKCTLKVIKSSAQSFVGVVKCDVNDATINIATEVINAKRHESQITTDLGELGQTKIESVSKWKADTCPDGV